MGCNNSSVDNSGRGTEVLKVNVASVPHVKEADVEEFKRKYISNDYITSDRAEEYKERLDNLTEIQFNRWDWMTKNPTLYVNMLRLAGHSDSSIQACFDGKRPLGMGEEIHKEYLDSLRELKKRLESETKLKNVRFIQTGSSVTGFSTNPHKGLRDIPSKLTNPESSDLDVVLVAEGVLDFIKEERAKEAPNREYPCTLSRDKNVKGIRYGLKYWSSIPPVKDWLALWKNKFEGGAQITLQEPNELLPPWERPIIL